MHLMLQSAPKVLQYCAVIILTLALTACGEAEPEAEVPETEVQNIGQTSQVIRFLVGSSGRFQITLPPQWIEESPKLIEGGIVTALGQNRQQVIITQQIAETYSGTRILESIKQQLTEVAIEYEGENDWIFHAKHAPKDPLSRYVQRAYLLPDEGLVLIASCRELLEGQYYECDNIVDSFSPLE